MIFSPNMPDEQQVALFFIFVLSLLAFFFAGYFVRAMRLPKRRDQCPLCGALPESAAEAGLDGDGADVTPQGGGGWGPIKTR